MTKKMGIVFCFICNKKLERPLSYIKKYKKSFCSSQCRKPRKEEVTCSNPECQSRFLVPSSKEKQNNYCSVSCLNRKRHLEVNKYNEYGEIVEKKCSSCKEWILYTEFNNQYNTKSGKHSRCKSCARVDSKISNYSLPDAIIEIIRNKKHTCYICKSTDDICVDHCHISGEFRGFLCRQCNVSLGLLKDNPERIYRLFLYAKYHQQRLKEVL